LRLSTWVESGPSSEPSSSTTMSSATAISIRVNPDWTCRVCVLTGRESARAGAYCVEATVLVYGVAPYSVPPIARVASGPL